MSNRSANIALSSIGAALGLVGRLITRFAYLPWASRPSYCPGARLFLHTGLRRSTNVHGLRLPEGKAAFELFRWW